SKQESVPPPGALECAQATRPYHEHHDRCQHEPQREERLDRHARDGVLHHEEARAPYERDRNETERREPYRRPLGIHLSRRTFNKPKSSRCSGALPGVSIISGTPRVAGCRKSSANGSIPMMP